APLKGRSELIGHGLLPVAAPGPLAGVGEWCRRSVEPSQQSVGLGVQLVLGVTGEELREVRRNALRERNGVAEVLTGDLGELVLGFLRGQLRLLQFGEVLLLDLVELGLEVRGRLLGSLACITLSGEGLLAGLSEVGRLALRRPGALVLALFVLAGLGLLLVALFRHGSPKSLGGEPDTASRGWVVLDPDELPGGGVDESRHARPQIRVLDEELTVARLRAAGHALDRLGPQPRPTAGEVALTRSAHIRPRRPTHRLVRQPAPGGTLGRHQSPLRTMHPAAGVDHLSRVGTVADRL